MNFERLKALDERIAHNIATAGWHLQGVFPGAGDDTVPFIYTVGLSPKVGYELLLIGAFPPHVSGDVLNRIAQKFVDAGKAQINGLIDIEYSVLMKLRPVEDIARCKDDYTCMVWRFVDGVDYKVVQVMLPDSDGVYQDDARCTLGGLVDMP